MSTDVLPETDFPPDLRERTGMVYISSPRTVDVEPLRAALRQNGFQPISLEDVPVAGTLVDVIREACLMSDFVVAVLDPELDRNVMYEIGVADGLNRPVLTFAAPSRDGAIPEEVRRRHAHLGPLTTPEKLAEQVAGVRKGVLGSRPHPPVVQVVQPLGADADAVRMRFLTAASTPTNPTPLAVALSQLLLDIGVGGMTSHNTDTGRVEAAVWNSEWTPWIPNPLVLDVWPTGGVGPTLGSLVPFSDSLADRSVGWGLVLASAFTPALVTEARQRAPYLLLLTYADLFDRLRTNSFPRIVVTLRNKRVHGEG